MKKFLAILTAAALCIPPAGLAADAVKPLIHMAPLSIRGLGAEEGRIVESLILAYLRIFGDVEIVEEEPDEGLVLVSTSPSPAPANIRQPDFTISGSVALDNDSRILTLKIGNPLTGETAVYSSTHKSASDLVLKVRALVESAISGWEPAAEEAPGSPMGERISEQGIIGAWRGDRGIEIIRLQKDGKGMAIFSSGALMDLTYEIRDNRLSVTQESPNTERYYFPVPYLIARDLVDIAEPMTWELSLHEGGTSLRGVKTATATVYQGEEILEVIPHSTREAEWIRIH